jgi:hypothetical protein
MAATAAPLHLPSDIVWVIFARSVAFSGHPNTAREMTRADAEAAGYARVIDSYVGEERYVSPEFLDSKNRFSRFDSNTYKADGTPEYFVRER